MKPTKGELKRARRLRADAEKAMEEARRSKNPQRIIHAQGIVQASEGYLVSIEATA